MQRVDTASYHTACHLLGMAFGTALMAFDVYSKRTSDRRRKAQVDGRFGHTIVNYYYEQAESGDLTAARQQVNRLDDIVRRFWVYFYTES